jgi:hypothetical protein
MRRTRTEVAHARNVVHVGVGVVTFVQSREHRRERARTRRALEQSNFDALGRVQPRRGLAWDIY